MKNSWLAFICLLCNILPFGVSWWFCGLIEANAKTALIHGAFFTVLGIAAAIVSHVYFHDHPISWVSSTLFLGFAKGVCISAILLNYYQETPHNSVYASFGIAVGAVCALFFVVLTLSKIAFVQAHPKSVYLPMLIAACIGAVVYLAVVPSPLGVLCWAFSGSLLIYWTARLLEFDEMRELRCNLSYASMLYVLFVFFIALACVSGGDCDCLEGCCEGCGGGSGESGGNTKKQNSFNSAQL